MKTIYADFSTLIGKKIIAFRGVSQKDLFDKKKEVTKLEYILFDDGETIMELREQDPYSYHDCSTRARELSVFKNQKLWEMMNAKENGYNEPDDLRWI